MEGEKNNRGDKMKGWILLEKGKPVINQDNSISVYITKKDLLNCYSESLGDLNSICKVKIITED